METRARHGLPLLVSAAVMLASLESCSNDSVSDTWLIPSAIPHPGSPVVTIWNSRLRVVLHHEEASFWSSGGDSPKSMETVESSYQDLDVRTCKGGRTRRYGRSGPSAEAEPTADYVPVAERAMMGPVRFYTDAPHASDLMAVNTITGQAWTVASSIGLVRGVTAVSAARRVVVVTESRSILVYDLDTNRVVRCR